MDPDRREGRGELLDSVHEGVDGNLSNLVEGVAIGAVDGSSLGGSASISGEAGTSGEVGKDLGSDKGQDKHDQEDISDNKLPEVDQGTSYNSNHSVNREVIETVVVIESVQTEYVNEDNLEAKVNKSGLSSVSMKTSEEVSETDKNSCVIDIKCSSGKKFYENSEGEKICRICHLASGQPLDAITVSTSNSATSSDLIQLGCACKDELGIAHVHCAEVWFKLKGNRLCEICGEAAKNVSGVTDYGFMEKWNERRFIDDDGNSSRRFGGCWRGQPFCNFLMACLIIAFVLPWFFRVNISYENRDTGNRTMLLTMAKSITNFSTYSTCNYHTNEANYAKPMNCFIFYRLSSRTCLLSSNLDVPRSTRVGAFAVLDENAKICKFCEVGDVRSAVELLRMSQKSEHDLNTYSSILQLCAEHKRLQEGKMVHSIISSNGIPIEGVLGAKLVFMYVSCGALREGRRIFDHILSDKVFLWNLMMSEYAKIGDYRESIYLFRKMQKLGITGNSYTFSCILKCFATLGRVGECKRIHGYIYKLGFGSYNTVVNSLISAYFKSGGVDSAHNLFDELGDRDVVSWNSMISGCVMNGFSHTGLEFFVQMLILRVGVDLATLVNALVACANVGSLSLGRAIHGHGVKACFSREVLFNNTLLDMYSKCGNLNDAIQAFEKMGQTTVVSWTSLIAAYVREGLYDDAIRLFYEMESKGVSPDVYSMTSVLHACACSNLLDKGRDVHNYFRKNNVVLNLSVSNALMDMYAKCGSMEEAYLVFSQIPVKDIVSWNTMIGGYSKNSLPNEALKLFAEMQEASRPDGITMACVLPACGSLAALEIGRGIHGCIFRNGYSSNLHVANALIDMYAKCGSLDHARLLFDMIPEKDLITWTVMIAGYGMHGFGNEAIATFQKMRIAGIKPDEITFTSILYACSHSGLLNEGWELFNFMISEYNMEPKLEHYACMVDLLARTGNLWKAYKFIETIPIKADATIWGALLCGCRIHHEVELAEKVAEHVFELEPEKVAEKWEEVKKLRERIGKRGLKNSPGCSWIEVQGKFTIFVSTDTAHPQAKRIVSLLNNLRIKMKSAGYSPKMRYALINADDMEKEVALCGHSEKLAMAFGILNLPPGRTIRVTKNLRVCSDCHQMAKFMSKTASREIILRDSNRFHHFKDGFCSCRDFW
ncbi:Pentatricopeptide repeat-containing protein DOT4, chloroplastic, partial [Mucuna pruriens]